MKRVLRTRQARILIAATQLCIISSSITAQSESEGEYRQYLFPEFCSGEVRMKTGSVRTVNINYNTVTEKMVYLQDTIMMDMGNTRFVDTVTIKGRKFVPFQDAFYEVAVNAPVTLFIQHRSNLNPPGQPAGYGTTSKTSSIESVSTIVTKTGVYNLKLPSDWDVVRSPLYWIRKNNTMYSFLNRKQFLKIFPDKSSELESYIKENDLKIDNITDLVQLVNYCNSIY